MGQVDEGSCLTNGQLLCVTLQRGSSGRLRDASAYVWQ